ncbi:MAG: copper chaperone PCu(A)C [Spirochaetota bacterium]
MPRITIISVFIISLLLALTPGCRGAKPKIKAEEVWSRPAASLNDEMGGMGVVYLTLINLSSEPDRLVGVESEMAENAELHTSGMKDGKMTMMHMEEGFEIPGGGRLTLESGGNHIMLIKLKKDLKPGDRFKVRLKFQKSNPLTVESEVRE